MEYTDLIKYLCQQFGIDEVTPLITRQLKRFLDEQKYTAFGIAATVNYCVDIKEPPVELQIEYGLGFVPFFYREAEAFFKHRRDVEKRVAAIDLTTVGETRVVNINESDRRKARESRMLDMDSLGGYDDE